MLYTSRKLGEYKCAAVGSSQAEFYTLDGDSYFSIYAANPESLRKVTLKLADWSVRKSRDGFELSRGSRTHKISITRSESGSTLRMKSYLWGWLPYNSHKGRVSATGMAVLIENFEKHT